jgi:hypothetical protein
MTVDFFTKFDSLYDEAVSNYDTSRFVDAAKNFDHIANYCMREGLLEDFVYFSYRSAIAWRSSNHINKLISLYQGFGRITLNYAKQLVEGQLENETDTQIRITLLVQYRSILGSLNNIEKKRKITEELIEHYLIKIDVDNEDIDDIIHYYGNIIEYLPEIDNSELTKHIYENIALLYVTRAEYSIKNNQFDGGLVAIQDYNNALVYYDKLDNKREIEIIKNKISSLQSI